MCGFVEAYGSERLPVTVMRILQRVCSQSTADLVWSANITRKKNVETKLQGAAALPLLPSLLASHYAMMNKIQHHCSIEIILLCLTLPQTAPCEASKKREPM